MDTPESLISSDARLTEELDWISCLEEDQLYVPIQIQTVESKMLTQRMALHLQIGDPVGEEQTF